MAPEEYRELVRFLGKRFDAIDDRFDVLEGGVTRNGVSIEEVRDELGTVAEGVAMNGERLDRMEPRLESVERSVLAHGGVLAGIAGKVDSIDGRLEVVEVRPGTVGAVKSPVTPSTELSNAPSVAAIAVGDPPSKTRLAEAMSDPRSPCHPQSPTLSRSDGSVKFP